MPLDSTSLRGLVLVNAAILVPAFLATLPAAAAQSATEAPIFSFGSSAQDATAPGNLIVGKDGSFYGLSSAGGSQNSGAFFSYSLTSGVETPLYSLPSSGSSASPPSPTGLVQAGDGNLYGTTSNGGANGFGAIFEYNLKTATGSLVHSFSVSTSDGVRPLSPVVGGDGNVYGVTLYGGATVSAGDPTGEGTIFKYDVTTGQESVLYSFGTVASDAVLPDALILGNDSNLYGLGSGGGGTSEGALFEYNTSAAQESVLSSFGTSATDGSFPTFLLQGSDGNFYGITGNGGADAIPGTSGGTGTLFEFVPSGATRSTLLSFGTSPVPGFYPTRLIQGTDGNLYGIGSEGAHDAGTFLEYILGSDTPVILSSFGASSSDAADPSALLQASDGNFYGTASGGSNGSGAIFKVSLAGTSSGTSTGGSSSGGGGLLLSDLLGLLVMVIVRRRKDHLVLRRA